MLRGRVGRGVFPPDDDLRLVSLATSLPQDHGLDVTRWCGDALAARIINEAHHRRMSRSTVCRHLQELDLKPHRSVYWLNSHDPDFDQKAQQICKLYVAAPQLSQQGRLLICSDEKTGMQILQRAAATHPAEPGKPVKRENDYIRHGTRVFIGSFVSWLNQIELWFAVLGRQFLAHGDFSSPAAFETAFWIYVNEYNERRAHPYRWTYTGQPLQRATPYSRTRRQAQHGRAFVHRRSHPFERILYPPRPYRRKSAPAPCPCGRTCETVI